MITKGEQKLINLFRRSGINFQREVSFNDLHGQGKALLRFDFGLYRNNKLVCLVEFDGIQHYQFTPYFHKSFINFRKQQEWDRKKNSYCLTHQIPLIRVPYWDLEDLTLKKVLTEPSYQVKSKYHIDELIRKGVNK